MKEQHIVIVRTGGSIINFESYNCQELGLAKALTQKGVKVSLVFAAAENKSIKFDYKGHEINIYLRRFKSVNQALAWFDDIEALLESLKPDMLQIHEFGMLMSWRVIRWAKKHNTPICLIQGSYRPTQKPIFKQLEQLFNHTLGKYILSNCDAIGCKTKMAAEYTAEYTDKSLMLTPIGLDVSKFETTDEYDWKTRLGINNDSDILLYVGNIEQRRNPLFRRRRYRSCGRSRRWYRWRKWFHRSQRCGGACRWVPTWLRRRRSADHASRNGCSWDPENC